jgi:hypothetical protein
MPHRRERERDREARDTWDNCLYKIACAGSAILVLYLALTGEFGSACISTERLKE